jgi:hypothetical protein
VKGFLFVLKTISAVANHDRIVLNYAVRKIPFLVNGMGYCEYGLVYSAVVDNKKQLFAILTSGE